MKTFLVALAIIVIAMVIAMSGSMLGHDQRPSYQELVDKNNELTWQIDAKELELQDIRQDIQDGLVPCNKSKENK